MMITISNVLPNPGHHYCVCTHSLKADGPVVWRLMMRVFNKSEVMPAGILPNVHGALPGHMLMHHAGIFEVFEGHESPVGSRRRLPPYIAGPAVPVSRTHQTMRGWKKADRLWQVWSGKLSPAMRAREQQFVY